MDDPENKNLPTTWIDVVKAVSEGGLPQVIAGPAGKALSRLIAGAADIPAAWLNSKAQSIKDKTDARTTIMKAVAKASAETAVADPQLLDRALARYVSDLHKKQENREAVARKAFEELSEAPAPAESVGPSDDWMNVFEEYAEKASSEELRQTWARVLAGEIRRPTSFSLRTLQFLSVLDKVTAEAVEAVLQRSFDGRYGVWPREVRGELFAQLNIARLAGVIGQIDTDTSHRKMFNSNGIAIFTFGQEVIVAHGEPGIEFDTQCCLVTIIGRELHQVIKPRPLPEALTELASRLQDNSHVRKIERGTLLTLNGMSYVNQPVTIWVRPTP
ncbi:DUF2806 domain-containing protein [Agrobacterium tumefaciens]|uniref:DUF2806 domain-containing protein n=1 Tax=Agrobacterium tumefaciens TaxID=358 RepID=UPI0021D25968|nr:DUF2806 domain-containing protein [Agrobacterium tumefaciens]UXS09214.1 DUF2806 domain-containing protein [Agrobacterium tumefaciens]UXS16573.1 DUF2806 domain-containing protein [Agrobacterium tumefaciens]